MFCPKCEKELEKQEIKISRWTGNRFCKRCGEKLTKLSVFAIVSLILAIPIFSFLGFLLAIIFGIIALVRISKNKGKLVGRSMAITGLSFGSFFILFPLAVILILPIFSTYRVKQAKKESQKIEKEVQKFKKETKELFAWSDMGSIDTAISLYYLDCDAYPSGKGKKTVVSFDALMRNAENRDGWDGPYLKKPISENPWGNKYEYEAATSNAQSYTIWCKGEKRDYKAYYCEPGDFKVSWHK